MLSFETSEHRPSGSPQGDLAGGSRFPELAGPVAAGRDQVDDHRLAGAARGEPEIEAAGLCAGYGLDQADTACRLARLEFAPGAFQTQGGGAPIHKLQAKKGLAILSP